jgi:hypothetical protein
MGPINARGRAKLARAGSLSAGRPVVLPLRILEATLSDSAVQDRDVAVPEHRNAHDVLEKIVLIAIG